MRGVIGLAIPKPSVSQLVTLARAARPALLRRTCLCGVATAAAETELLPSTPSASATVRPSGATDEFIAASIAATQRRRAGRPQYHCPSCDQLIINAHHLHAHLLNCCADHVKPEEWEQALSSAYPDPATIMPLLAACHEREAALRDQALHLLFTRSSVQSEAGKAVRMEMIELARCMDLPVPRVLVIVRVAMAAIPFPIDTHETVDVVHEDDHFLAVNKPVGVSTTPAHRYKGGTMLNRVIAHLGYEPFMLHRIDMNTSGLLLFAKSIEVARGVHKQFRERTLHKLYLAIGIGAPAETTFRVDERIDRHPTLSIARAVGPAGKPARTDFVVEACNPSIRLGAAAGARPGMLYGLPPGALPVERRGPVKGESPSSSAAASSSASDEAGPSSSAEGAVGEAAPSAWPSGACLLSCSPHSGRTHQIRVHAAHVGHSLIGDEVYGAEGPWISRQALHASVMVVVNPVTGVRMALHAPPLPDFRAAVTACGLDSADMGEVMDRFARDAFEKSKAAGQ